MRPSDDAVRLLWPESAVFRHTPETLAALRTRLAQAYDVDRARLVRVYLREQLGDRVMHLYDVELGRDVAVVPLCGTFVSWDDLRRELGL